MANSTAKIVFRQASPGDAAELARLRWEFSTDEVASNRQSRDDFHAGFVEFVAEALASGRWAIWVAETDGRLVAHIYVQAVEKVPRPGRFGASLGNRWGYVTNVYADAAVRNQGIGSQLLQRVVAWGKEQRFDLVLLWPSEQSVPFYERAGFVHSPEGLEYHYL